MITDRELDRLVDGDLNESEYHAVLSALECEPQGWRRCAMAFLECQAWQNDLTKSIQSTATTQCVIEAELAAASGASDLRQVGVDATSSRVPRVPVYAQWIAAALVGMLVSQIPWIKNRNEPVRSTEIHLARDSDVGHRVPLHGSDANVAHKATQGVRDELRPDGARKGESTKWALVLQDGYQTQAGDWAMPIHEWDDGQGRAALDRSSNLPESWENELRRAGHSVRRKKAFTPVELSDGRQIVIPWEQVEIVPISQQVLP